MELNEHDIAQIESYLQGSLQGDELAAFEQRLQDPDFAGEVELMRDLIGGTQAAGRQQLKADIGAIGASVLAGTEFNQYQPPKPKGTGGSSIGGKLVTLAFVAAAGYGSYLWFTDQFPPDWAKPYVPEQLAPAPAQPPQTIMQVETLNVYKDANGNIITKEEYEALSAEQEK